MSNIYCPELRGIRRPRYQTPERDKYLRENSFLDASILAAEFGISVRWLEKYQRTLGLRKCRYREYD